MIIKWRTVAIIALTLLVFTWAFVGYGWYLVAEEEEKTMQCYYETCADYPEAWYEASTQLCSCYDYDYLGNPVVEKEVWLK